MQKKAGTCSHALVQEVEVSEVREEHVLDEIYAFRARVWSSVGGLAHHAFPDGQWRDAHDNVARHWVVRDEHGLLIAAARLTIHPELGLVPESPEYLRYCPRLHGPIAAPGRVVVCPSAQGMGLGWRMLDIQDEAARQAGAAHAVRQASPTMVRLLTRRGWRILGPASLDARFPDVTFQVAVLDLRA